MKKTRIILAATGGVLALAVLAMAVLTWLAFADRAEALGGEEGGGLAEAVSKVEKLQKKAPFPSEENRRQLEANADDVVNWRSDVSRAISRGDWCETDERTPAQFKEQIAVEAKVLQRLENADHEPLMKPDFTFGPFKDYLADKMPTVSQLPRLQRQWFDITSLIDVLGTNGCTKVLDLQVVDRAEAGAEAKGKGKAKAKTGAEAKAKATAKATTKAKAKATDETKAEGAKEIVAYREPSVETYRLTFVARPADFVAALQKLSFQDRFTVVESFGFVRERDTIAETLGGGEKKEKVVAAGGRRGRRRGRQEETPAEEQTGEANGERNTVFDPSTDAAMKVEMTVSVYDFHSLEGLTKDATEKEGDSK